MRQRLRPLTIVLIIVAVVLLAVALFVKLRQPKSKASPGQGAAVKSGSAGSGSGSPSTATSTQPNPPAQTKTGQTTTSIGKPTVTLSNHNVSLSGSTTEDSTCQTVAGATCDIRLTGPNGAVKTLGVKAVDGYGGADFVWDVKKEGLAAGQWQVQAVASKGGDTEVSAAENLTVSQ